MSLTPKQKILTDYILANGSITTSKANELLCNFYYHNHSHYVSEILTRLVKGGVLVRIKQGNYVLKHKPTNEIQQTIF